MNNDITVKAERSLEELRQDSHLSPYIDPQYGIPSPYIGKGPIRLIVLGQDPTVKNAASRQSIRTVLNLDTNGSVRGYLSGVCQKLGIDLSQNVYATNLFKNFFVEPPTQIQKKGFDIFQAFLPVWLPLLDEELGQYPAIPVITLGEPVLQTLLAPGMPTRLRDYWGYAPEWKEGKLGAFQFIKPAENKLGRTIFPFPHQPSIRKEFYKMRMDGYIAFMKAIAFPA
jgi:hypothetical protein